MYQGELGCVGGIISTELRSLVEVNGIQQLKFVLGLNSGGCHA